MLQLAFELTNRCDIACLHCLRDKNDVRDDISRDFVTRILEESEALGVRLISFTGGEPTLHPDYIYFIDEVAKRGMRWITVTNGHNAELFKEVFSDPKRFASLSMLAISLDGASEEVHDKIRGKGRLRKIMKTTTLLSKMGANVRFQMTLNRLNYPEMEEFVSLSANMGLKSAYFAYMQPTKKNVAADLMLSPDEYRRATIKIAKLNTMYTIEVGHTFGYYHPSPLLKCSILNNNAMNVDYQGNMIFCCQLSNFGDVTYVYDRKEIIADLNKVPLVEGYKSMLDAINAYNKEKADKAAAGAVKGLDLFPCFYCAKCFGKLNWLGDADVKNNADIAAWQNPDRDLSSALIEDKPAGHMPIKTLTPWGA